MRIGLIGMTVAAVLAAGTVAAPAEAGVQHYGRYDHDRGWNHHGGWHGRDRGYDRHWRQDRRWHHRGGYRHGYRHHYYGHHYGR